MKKFFVLIPLFALACSQAPKIVPPCREASVSCESQKKFMLLKITELPKDLVAVDAFGDSLSIGRWYLRSNTTHVVFPIGSKNPDVTMEIGYDQLELMCFPLQSAKKIKAEKVLINTGDAGSPGGLYIIAEILVNKDGDILLDENDKATHPYLGRY